MTQVVECWPSKHRALSSNHNTTKKERDRETERRKKERKERRKNLKIL
jgi:hypothetical protein